MNSGLTIRQYQGRTGFDEIRGPWHDLMPSVRFPSFYHHPLWFDSYFDRPDVREDMHFRCAYDGSGLVAVLPLHFSTRFGGMLREATFPAYDGLYMPDMAVSDAVSPAQAWAELCPRDSQDVDPRWDVFTAASVLAESAISRALRSSTLDTVYCSRSGKCAILDVRPYDEIQRSLKKKFRGNLNNAKNRLKKEPDVEFLNQVEEDQLLPAFDEFVNLEKSGWKGNPDKIRENYPLPAAIALKRSKYLFYRNVVREFGKHGSIEICLLKVRGKTIGAQIYLLLGKISYLLKTAFDESGKAFSPGHLLLDNAFRRYALSNKIEQICLITDYEWFNYWNPRYIDYLRIKAFARGLRGRSASFAYSLSR